MIRKQNDFGAKYGNEENMTEKPNGLTRWKKNKKDSKKVLRRKIHVDSHRVTLKNVPNGKTPGHDGIRGYWFKKFTFTHDRLVIEMNRRLEVTDISEWMTKGKTNSIAKDPPLKKEPQTHNVSTDDVENTNGTNQGGDLLFANKP